MSALVFTEAETPATLELLACGGCGRQRAVTAEWKQQLLDHKCAEGLTPDQDVLEIVLRRFRCTKCGQRRARIVKVLVSRRHPDRLCVQCREPISPVRLKAMPSAERCVRCEGARERQVPQKNEHGNCHVCGAEMVLRQRTRVFPVKYFLGCSRYPHCNFVIAGTW